MILQTGVHPVVAQVEAMSLLVANFIPTLGRSQPRPSLSRPPLRTYFFDCGVLGRLSIVRILTLSLYSLLTGVVPFASSRRHLSPMLITAWTIVHLHS